MGNGQPRPKLKVPARHLSGVSEKCPGETSVRMVVGSGINPKISLMLSQRSNSDPRPLGSTVLIFIVLNIFNLETAKSIQMSKNSLGSCESVS